MKHYRTCNLCEAMCGLVIDYDGEKVNSIKGDPQDPFSQGHICPKAVALQDLHSDPDRIRKPLKKVDGTWQEMEWEEAFDYVAEQLKRVQASYGKDAVALYQGNPSVHNLGHMLYGPAFARALRTKNKYSASSVDQLPHHLVSQAMFGHMMLIPIPDLLRTDFILVLGANPMVSNGSLMTCGGFSDKLKGLKDRGGKMVVIDPRFTETAAKANQHYFIKPGTDALLLLEMLRYLVLDKGVSIPNDQKSYYKNWEVLVSALTELPHDISIPTGIPILEIHRLAQQFLEAKTAVCYGRMGVSTQAFGSLTQWLINLLNIVTGNFDQPGGALFNTPAVDVVKLLGAKGTQHKQGRYHSRVRNLPEFYGELPVATLADEILTEGPGQVKALITAAGNPVLSTPQGNRLKTGLKQLEFQVAIDIYLNETTRHADVILPPTTGLEQAHYDLIFNTFAIQNVAKYSAPLFERSRKAKYDWEIFKALTLRLQSKKTPWYAKLWNKWTTPERLLDLALRTGPYGQLNSWKPGGLTLKRLRRHPHGLVMGPLKSQIPQRLFTKDQKVDLTPKLLQEDLNRLINNPKPNGDLVLIGRRGLRDNNSWMHNISRLVKGPNRCTVLMHPHDATQRGLQQGQTVTVQSRVGKISIELQVTDEMMPGVVSIPHGWGHESTDSQSVASKAPGVSINELTDAQLLDEPSGNAAFSGVKVEVF